LQPADEETVNVSVSVPPAVETPVNTGDAEVVEDNVPSVGVDHETVAPPAGFACRVTVEPVQTLTGVVGVAVGSGSIVTFTVPVLLHVVVVFVTSNVIA